METPAANKGCARMRKTTGGLGSTRLGGGVYRSQRDLREQLDLPHRRIDIEIAIFDMKYRLGNSHGSIVERVP